MTGFLLEDAIGVRISTTGTRIAKRKRKTVYVVSVQENMTPEHAPTLF